MAGGTSFEINEKFDHLAVGFVTIERHMERSAICLGTQRLHIAFCIALAPLTGSILTGGWLSLHIDIGAGSKQELGRIEVAGLRSDGRVRWEGAGGGCGGRVRWEGAVGGCGERVW